MEILPNFGMPHPIAPPLLSSSIKNWPRSHSIPLRSFISPKRYMPTVARGLITCLFGPIRKTLQPLKTSASRIKFFDNWNLISVRCRALSNMADVVKVTADRGDPPYGRRLGPSFAGHMYIYKCHCLIVNKLFDWMLMYQLIFYKNSNSPYCRVPELQVKKGRVSLG